MARALVRRRELAVRTALGAGRERLVRQLLTESLLLGLGGGVLGVLIAAAAIPLLAELVPTALPIAATPTVDLRVLGFALLLTAATGIGFGALPALRAARGADAGALREGRGGVEARRERLRSVLVTVQVTLSVVLLIATGLLVRTLWQVQAVDPGFRPEGVLTLRTALTMPRYEPTALRERFYRQVLSQVRALPGVTEASYTSFLPIAVQGGIWPVTVPGHPERPGSQAASLRFVTPRYFATLGIPLRQGRDVRDSDSGEAPFVAVVSASFARRYWPGRDPLGRRFEIGFRERTVVGVAGDVRVRGLERLSEPQVYLPSAQVPDGGLVWYAPKDLAIRAELPPASLLPAVRAIVAAADPQQPISDVQTLAEIVADRQRAPLGPGAAAERLRRHRPAAGGHRPARAVRLRRLEPAAGDRRADGPRGRRPGHVLGLVLGRGLLLAGLGVAAGLLLAAAVGRGLQALLVGVSPWDAATFASAVAVALAMTLAGQPAARLARGPGRPAERHPRRLGTVFEVVGSPRFARRPAPVVRWPRQVRGRRGRRRRG